MAPRSEAEQQALLDLATTALLGDEPRYRAEQVCERAGVDRETADLLWRAMGFPDAPDDEAAFTDRDVEALRTADALTDGELVDAQAVRAQTRVMSQAMATIAAAHLQITDPAERDVEGLTAFVDQVLPALDGLLVYLYRRHLLAEVERTVLLDRAVEEVPTPTVAVGFADLVGFTKVSNHLEEDELARLIEGFNQAAGDVVAEGGGRVVKMIGDEVMFAANDGAGAARIALRLVAEVGGHNGLPELRAGVAAGPVVMRHGDVFGSTANLAHRLVEAARPGTVLADEDVQAAVEAEDDLEAVRIHGLRRLPGFDRVRVWTVRPRAVELDEAAS